MERRRITTLGLAVLTVMAVAVLLWAAGSAGASPPLGPAAQSGAPLLLNYQGRLVDPDTGEPVPNGNYGITFRIYNAAGGGALIWSETQTVKVEGGLFNVLLGSATPLSAADFDGTARWLELEVEGETLTPRQRIVSAPYAIQAEWAKNAASAPWGGLTDVPAGFADGVDNDTLGGLSCAGGEVAKWNDGTSQWECGTDLTGGAGTFWALTGNGGTAPGTNFLGTTDNVALQLHVNSARALRLEPNATSPNLIGGSISNTVTSNVVGATIGGGGEVDDANVVTDDFGTVGGGASNQAGDNAGGTSDANYATVGGGYHNTASGTYATVGGGDYNTASSIEATVGGGEDNTASGPLATVGGGDTNTASAYAATVGGGERNTASQNYATVGGGYHNTASGTYATVGGGDYNTASSIEATVGGGEDNTASGPLATVGGGDTNTASAYAATVGGGESNTASGSHATVGGGYYNTASGYYATVGGGYQNTASDYYAAVGGGQSNTASFAYATVGGGYRNTSSGEYATVSGGNTNVVSGTNATVGGGYHNTASDFAAAVGGGYQNTASGPYATVGGGYTNIVSGTHATVGGGYKNTASGRDSTVGGGLRNTASGNYATVGGGEDNTAGGDNATVGGGDSNTASYDNATVGGGALNTASGRSATIPGGANNEAVGNYSFAAGRQAKANHQGAFVWADSTAANFASIADDQFMVQASGGISMYTNSTLSSGMYLSPGGSAWNAVSDRERKENLAPVDTNVLLARLAEIPITTWNYKAQDPSIRHIGPMAQDFNTLVEGLGGEGEKYINTLDADGVALAAIQALAAENAALREQVAALDDRVAALEAQSRSPFGSWGPLGLLFGGLVLGLVVVRRNDLKGGGP